MTVSKAYRNIFRIYPLIFFLTITSGPSGDLFQRIGKHARRDLLGSR
jgi:hypothetical protein